MGADSMVSEGLDSPHSTVKVHKVGQNLIVGSAGLVSVAQQIRHGISGLLTGPEESHPWESVDEARERLFEGLGEKLNPWWERAQKAGRGADDVGHHTLVGIPIGESAHLFSLDTLCYPQELDGGMMFCCAGSGAEAAKKFLAHLSKALWEDKRPSLSQAVFSTIWTLLHTIDISAGLVAEPINVFTLTKNKEKEWVVEERDADHLEMDRGRVEATQAAMREYWDLSEAERAETKDPMPKKDIPPPASTSTK